MDKQDAAPVAHVDPPTTAPRTVQPFPTSWIIIVVILFLFVGAAFVLSLCAYLDAQSNDAHQDLRRRNVRVCSDLVVDGETRLEGTVFANSNVYVDQTLESGSIVSNRAAWFSASSLRQTGTVSLLPLLKSTSCIRIDTPGTNAIVLTLPRANEVPLQSVSLLISQAGCGNTVNLAVSGSDILVALDGTATSVNPVATYPRNANQPDSMLLTNDGVSVWYLR